MWKKALAATGAPHCGFLTVEGYKRQPQNLGPSLPVISFGDAVLSAIRSSEMRCSSSLTDNAEALN